MVDRLHVISLYKLTQSRLQSGLVLAFSSMAFIFGVVNLSTTWKRSYDYHSMECELLLMCVTATCRNSLPDNLQRLVSGTDFKRSPSALLRVRHFRNRCRARLIFPFEVFLTRALLTSRSGMRRSNSVVHHFVRNAIQIGVFATLWSLAALGTYFLLPRWTIYTVFDMTSGSIYTHVGRRSLSRASRAQKNYPSR